MQSTALYAAMDRVEEYESNDEFLQVSKKTRISRACLNCRKRRIKCDGNVPCAYCMSMALECAPRKRGPLSQAQQLKDLEQRLDVLTHIVVNHVPGAGEAMNIQPAIESNSSLAASTWITADDMFTLVQEGSTSTLRFLGNSSDIHPFLLKQSPRFHGGVFHLPILQDTRTHTLSRSALPEICPLALHVFLGEIYFKAIHPYYPMLDRDEYFLQLNAPKISDEFAVLKYSVSAVVAQIIGPLPQWNIPHSFPLSLALIRRAKTLLPNQIDRCCLFTIQACLVLSICGCASIESLNPSMYIALAVQMCQELGLHRNLNRFGSALSETHKRTWFCALILDRKFSLCVGRPCSIRDNEWDTLMPDWTVNPIHNQHIDTAAFDNLITLMKAVGRVLEIGFGIHMQNRLRKLDQAIRDLSIWFSRLPQNLINLISGINPRTWSLSHVLGLTYHACIIIAHRFKEEQCPGEILEQMRLLFVQTPKINLEDFAYVVPQQIYLSTLLANTYISDAHNPLNLQNLRILLQSQIKLECTYSYAFKERAFINELLASKHFQPESVLGKELATMLPLGASVVELKEIYQILVGSGVKRVEVDQAGSVRVVEAKASDERPDGIEIDLFNEAFNQFIVPKHN